MSDISRSLEDYVEAIYMILQEKKVARVKDISVRLNVKRPSVTSAIKNLAGMDLVNHTPYSYITLTPAGEELGKEMETRHRTVRNFFTNILGINADKANEAACRIEHALDTEILEKLIAMAEFLEGCPRAGLDWIREHMSKCDFTEPDEGCTDCIQACLDRAAPSVTRNAQQ
ncbi:metal-dependent transcriptional regulator [Planctomycetota bacterium]